MVSPLLARHQRMCMKLTAPASGAVRTC